MLLHGKSEIIALLSRLPAIIFPVVPKLCLGTRQCRSGVQPPTGSRSDVYLLLPSAFAAARDWEKRQTAPA